MTWALRFFKTLIVVKILGIALGAAITLQQGGTTKRSVKAKHRYKLKVGLQVLRFKFSLRIVKKHKSLKTLLYVCDVL